MHAYKIDAQVYYYKYESILCTLFYITLSSKKFIRLATEVVKNGLAGSHKKVKLGLMLHVLTS